MPLLCQKRLNFVNFLLPNRSIIPVFFELNRVIKIPVAHPHWRREIQSACEEFTASYRHLFLQTYVMHFRSSPSREGITTSTYLLNLNHYSGLLIGSHSYVLYVSK